MIFTSCVFVLRRSSKGPVAAVVDCKTRFWPAVLGSDRVCLLAFASAVVLYLTQFRLSLLQYGYPLWI